MVVAVIACVLALGGVGYAGQAVVNSDDNPVAGNAKLKKNSITSRYIRNRNVKHIDIGRNAVHSDNVCPDCVFGTDIKESSLGKVPSAGTADTATEANHAANAEHAKDADHSKVADALASETIIPRSTLDFTAINPVTRLDEGGNTSTLATVGGLKIEGLCRVTQGDGTGTRRNRTDEAESKVLLWSDGQALTFSGRVGPRKNVPAGAISYDDANVPNPDPNDANDTNPGDANDPTLYPNGVTGWSTTVDPPAGEGNHMFLAASNEFRDEDRWSGTPDDGGVGGFPGYQSWVGIVNLDDGSTYILSMYTGFRTLGVANRCVYGGMVRQIS